MNQENLEKLKVLLYQQAKILAVTAEIEGMKTANTELLNAGYSVAYSDEAFFSKAAEIRRLANHMIEEFRRKS